MSARNLTTKQLRLISAEIADQEITMEGFARNQCKYRRVGSFSTLEAIASDVPDSQM
jgi:hypothetical protein